MNTRLSLVVLLWMVFTLGCLEEELSPVEMSTCLEATRLSVSLIPECGDVLKCKNEFDARVGTSEYVHLPIGNTHLQTQQAMANAWNRMRQADHIVRKLHGQCSKSKAGDLISSAVSGAAELQSALSYSEAAQLQTYAAMSRTIEHAATHELEQVKDTRAFEEYIQLVQWAHELEMNNPTSTWGMQFEQTQKYFQQIGKSLASNDTLGYEVDLDGVLGIYKIGGSILVPEKKKMVDATSLAWKGTLSALLGKSKSANALDIVSQVKAGDVMQHVELVVEPQNGLLIRAWKSMAELERGLEELYQEEKTLAMETKKRLEVLREKNNSQAEQLVQEWEMLEDSRIHESIPVGRRVAEWRKSVREINEVEQDVQEKEAMHALTSEITLELCLVKLQAFQEALDIPFNPHEWWEESFGDASQHACESAKINAENEYELQPHVKEIRELEQKLHQRINATHLARTILKWENQKEWPAFLEKTHTMEKMDEPLQPHQLLQKKYLLEELVTEAGEWIQTMMQEAGNRVQWSVKNPHAWEADKKYSMEWVGTLPAWWKNEVDVPFIITVQNPGIENVLPMEGSSTVILAGDALLVEGGRLTAAPLVLRGAGSATPIQTTPLQKEIWISEENAVIQERVNVSTTLLPSWMNWMWKIPPGTAAAKVEVYLNQKNVETNTTGSILRATILLQEKTNELMIRYENGNALHVQTNVEKQSEEWGRIRTTYRVEARNNLDEEIIAAISTGITGDHVITQNIAATDTEGKNVEYGITLTGAILLHDIKIPPQSTRVFFVQTTLYEGAEEWGSLVESLLMESQELSQNENQTIANKAQQLNGGLIQLYNEKNTMEFARKLIGFQNEIENLARQANNQVEKETIEQHVNTLTEKKPESSTGKENYLKKIMEEQQRGKETGEEIKHYLLELALGCAKLSKVNYTCPLSEANVQESKKIVMNNQSTLAKWIKKMEKLPEEQIEMEWGAIQTEWMQMNEQHAHILEQTRYARSVLEETTHEVLLQLEQEVKNNTTEEIISAVTKAKDAWQKKEYGKAMFIGQNLLNYSKGNRATGLASIPGVAWPLAGVLFLGLGAWGYHSWKKKQTKVVIPKKIQKGNEKTLTHLNEEDKMDNSGPAPPPRQEGLQLLSIGASAPETRTQRERLDSIEWENLPAKRKKKMPPRTIAPHSPREE